MPIFRPPIWLCDHAILQSKQFLRIAIEVENYDDSQSASYTLIFKSRNTQITRAAQITDGIFYIEIPEQEAHSQLEIHFCCGPIETTITDLLFGDVYIFSGQSNMEWPLSKAAEFEKALEEFKPELAIRFFAIPKMPFSGADKIYPDHFSNSSSWETCSAENIPNWSALAYFASKDIFEQNNHPIGIIANYWGGTSICSWLPEHLLASHPQYGQRFKEFLDETNFWDDPDYAKHKIEMANYLKTGQWPPPDGPHSFLRPGALYATMLKKLEGISVRALIWYQGESDADLGLAYAHVLKDLLAQYRSLIHVDLDCFIVELPGFRSEFDWGKTRLAQFQVQNSHVANYIIRNIDLGDENDIHPIRKREIGQRIAHALLSPKKYRFPKISIQIEPPTTKIDFEENIVGGTKNISNYLKLWDDGGKALSYDISVNGSTIIISNYSTYKRLELLCDDFPIYGREDLHLESGQSLVPYYLEN